MAIIYVDDAAAGANDGTSWTDAYTTIQNAGVVAAASGNDIWIASTHAEAIVGALSLVFANGTALIPIIVKSIDTSDDTYDPVVGVGSGANGAKVSTTGTSNITINGYVQFYGIEIDCADDFFPSLANQSMKFEQCKVTIGDLCRQNGVDSVIEWVNCEIISSDTLTFYDLRNSGSIAKFIGCTITHSSTNYLLDTSADTVFAEFIGCSLLTTDSIVNSVTTGDPQIILRKCKMIASFAIATTFSSRHGFIFLEGCSSDVTLTEPEIGLTSLTTGFGTTSSSLTIYRTGGADDGERNPNNPYSWKMVTNASALEQYSALKTPPMVLWAGPDTTPASATAQGIITSTRMLMQGTPAALTTDATSTWTGSGVGTKQKITHTLNNDNGTTLTVYVASGGTLNDDDFWIEVEEPDQVGGPFTVRAFLAKPSTTVYIDPKLEVA